MRTAIALVFAALSSSAADEFDCYVQSAETRIQASLHNPPARDPRIQTKAVSGASPLHVTGGLIHDWIGTVFIPGVTLDRTIRMLQDYDHRAQYFGEILSASKLLCRTGPDRFRVAMRLKEPAVIDTENEVVWERLDEHHWRNHSYSTRIQEIGKDHGYLLRLNSYWRFAEVDNGVYVEGETITLSGEFGSVMRALGSMAGISPEKSLRRTLAAMRDSVQKPGLEFAPPPSGLPDCGDPIKPKGCSR